MNLLQPSNRAASLRSTGLTFLSFIPIFAFIFTVHALGDYIATVGLALALAVVGIYLLTLLLSLIGLGYLVDYFLLKIDSRYSKVVAVLKLEDVHLGTFRHSLNCEVQEQPFGQKYKGKELLITVAATRRGLKAALASMTS